MQNGETDQTALMCWLVVFPVPACCKVPFHIMPPMYMINIWITRDIETVNLIL